VGLRAARLADSFHTEGFFRRESSLFHQLVPKPVTTRRRLSGGRGLGRRVATGSSGLIVGRARRQASRSTDRVVTRVTGGVVGSVQGVPTGIAPHPSRGRARGGRRLVDVLREWLRERVSDEVPMARARRWSRPAACAWTATSRAPGRPLRRGEHIEALLDPEQLRAARCGSIDRSS
jgi:hypothetical protein